MKLVSPAAERNQSLIFEVLDSFLVPRAQVLELASGTGQHGHFICKLRPDISWQPSDIDPQALTSIQAWRSESALANFLSPLVLNVEDKFDSVLEESIDAIVAINMIHISPWEACIGLLEQARILLVPKGILYLYGPYMVAGKVTAESNLRFDASLRQRNANWGLRDLDRVVSEAATRGLQRVQTVEMPANNLSIIFRKN